MTDEDDFTELLDPKTNRAPEEVGREIFRLLQQYDEIRVTQGETKYDVQLSVRE